MRKLVIIILSLVFSAQLSAQKMMTLEYCRKQAVEYNKELKKAQYQKEEAVTNQKTARTAYLPDLSASANGMYLPDIEGFSMPGGFLPTAASEEAALNGDFTGVSNVWSPGINLELDNLSVLYGSVTFTQPVYAGGKIRYANKQADAGVKIYEHNYDLKYAEIIEQTDKLYWNIASISANVKLAQKYIEMLTELEEQMTEMYNLGLTPASEKLKVTVQKNEAELKFIRAKNGLRISKMYLNQIIGQDLNTDIQITDSLSYDIELMNMSNGVDRALLNRDELAILEKQLEISINKFESLYKNFTIENSSDNYQAILNAIKRGEKTYRKRFLITGASSFYKIETKDIAYFYTTNRITFAAMFDKKEHVINFTMEKLEEELDPDMFFRANRSQIIHIDSIKKFESYFGGKLMVRLIGPFNEPITISRLKATEFKSWIDR